MNVRERWLVLAITHWKVGNLWQAIGASREVEDTQMWLDLLAWAGWKWK